jgi:hypothetical protein
MRQAAAAAEEQSNRIRQEAAAEEAEASSNISESTDSTNVSGKNVCPTYSYKLSKPSNFRTDPKNTTSVLSLDINNLYESYDTENKNDTENKKLYQLLPGNKIRIINEKKNKGFRTTDGKEYSIVTDQCFENSEKKYLTVPVTLYNAGVLTSDTFLIKEISSETKNEILKTETENDILIKQTDAQNGGKRRSQRNKKTKKTKRKSIKKKSKRNSKRSKKQRSKKRR